MTKNRLTVLLLFLLALPLFSGACAPEGTPSSGKAKIYVEEEGIYHLTYSALREVGLYLKGIAPAMIRLTNRGQEVPIWIVGEGGDSTIEFYGTANESRYSLANVYWLTIGQAAGKRMEERPVSSEEVVSFPSSFRAILHREEDLLYWSKAPQGADRWYWQSLIAPASATFTLATAALRHLADGDGILRVALLGSTYDLAKPDHHIRVLLNDYLIADATWDGQERYLVETATPHFLEGENVLLLEAPGDTGARADVVLLDWYEIGYQRRFVAKDDCLQFEGRCPEAPPELDEGLVEGHARAYRIAGFSQPDVVIFDITDPANAVRLIGQAVEREGNAYTVSFSDSITGRRRYLAVSSRAIKRPARIAPASPTDLRAPDKQADYIVITHPNFRQSLQPLIEWRRSRGLKVVVATIDEVYDEFNHGLPDPAAIRDFLRYARDHWAKPAPRYVLLVGDASYDYRDHLKAPNKNLIPTYLLETHFVGETASDNWFVRLDDDVVPNMAIGRLPVKSVAQARIVVDKIIGYERDPTPGEWRRRVLFVADDEPIFESTSDDLAESYLPPDYQATKVYLSAFGDPEESGARIIEEINEGAAIVSYIGHAALDVWAKERMFASEDIASLKNRARLPFVVTMTCLDGYFHHPEADCLAEELLLAGGGGAIACFAPTSESLPSDQDVLVKALFEALFAGDASTIGEAVMQAKRSLPNGGPGY
ncbi:MAG: hypothetical protein H8E35_05770, partial [Ardenticatenia bacterium]|nr:hypothetical protein [Ardenticatenia bacterium]